MLRRESRYWETLGDRINLENAVVGVLAAGVPIEDFTDFEVVASGFSSKLLLTGYRFMSQ
jgi:hypothetical protein